MAIRLEGLTRRLGEDESVVAGRAADRLGVSVGEITGVRIVRRSLDARRKPEVVWRYAVEVEFQDQETQRRVLERLSGTDVKHVEREEDEVPRSTGKPVRRVVIVGTGPAGLFAGLALAQAGWRPVLLERGKSVKERAADYGRFLNTRELDTESNLLFGEGGAGTWSDGKLRTRTRGRWTGYVLRRLVEAGAPADIEYDAKPHLGTDVLRGVIPRIRERIEQLSGEVKFGCRMTGLARCGEGVKVETTAGELEAETLVLAVGSSARDTFQMLSGAGMQLETKAFQAGLRIEHKQEMIDRAQYGDAALDQGLPRADYELVHQGSGTREMTVHTFCMCPGGEVVATVSERGRLCVNGMSERVRAGKFANSALVWTVRTGSWEEGVAYQRGLEERAFRTGGGDYGAPGQRVREFMSARRSVGNLESSYRLGVRGSNLAEVVGDAAARSLVSALRDFGRRVKGFGTEGILIGVEARASSPVRMVRDVTTREAVGFPGVYPVGEGAGYAGGIMSAAVDGIETAVKIMQNDE